MFTLATATLLLGLGAMAREPGRLLVAVALVTALAALLVDVYLY